MSNLSNAGKGDEKVKNEGKEHALQLSKEQADAYRSVTKTLEELQAKIKGVSQETAASTPVQMAQAKAFAESEQVISRLRESLAEHSLTLKASDAAQIRSMETTLADLELQKTTNAEFQKTIDGINSKISDCVRTAIPDRQMMATINSKIDAYKRLTAAIGAGYAAQRAAYVADAVQRGSEGKNYSQNQVVALGNKAGAEYDAQQDSKAGVDASKIADHTAILNAEASATLRGSEAVREFALQQRIKNATEDLSIENAHKLADALTAEAAAQEKLKTDEMIAKLNLETQAQQLLNAARLQGADAIRAAQLQNQIAAIKATTAPGAEQDKLIGATQAQAQAAEQTRILDLATQIDLSNKTKLEDLDKIIAKQKQIGASEYAIKETEKERTDLLDKIALQSGSVADVLRAAADRMAASADHVREQLVASIEELQNGVNDQLAKLATGQKTSFAKMFTQQGESGLKTGFKDIEGLALGKFGLGGGKHDGSSEANALYVRLAGSANPVKIGGAAKGLAGFGSDTNGLTGQGPLAADGLPFGSMALAPLNFGDTGGGGVLSSLAGLFKNFAGGFAEGGDIPGGSTALVGEAGPELVKTGSAGMNVTPNSSLGGVTNYYTIDARNSDAAAVEQRVRNAIHASGAQSVTRAYQATAEHARRNPK